MTCRETRDDLYVRPAFSRWTTGPCREEQQDGWLTAVAGETSRPKDFDVPFSSVLENAKQLSLFVDMDSEVLGGTPRVGGTRIPVYRVLNAIDEYGSIDGATIAYRSLTVEQVRDAVQFAAHVLESPVEHEAETVD
jgi:uncharacterized protein (DUF433 family)